MSESFFQNNRICRMLGIKHPIIGAPMFLVSYPDLVTAVSEAGGVGCFPSANYRTVEELDAGIQHIRSRTKQPIGVNIILREDHNPRWRSQFETVLKNKVELIIFSLGVKRDVVREARAAGSKVFFDVTTLKHARLAAASGVDAVIAVAQGAGGHAGSITPFTLIQQIKAAVDVPVIAAGAISNGAQMAAALCLGADAVYVGTRFIATPEAQASEDYKRMILDASPEDIIYSEKVSGIPANWLKESFTRWEKSQVEGADDGDEMKRWRDIWSAGQGVAQIDAIEPAGEIVRKMAADCATTLRSLSGDLVDASGVAK
jgi:nitronate monooxygenase